MKNTKTTIVPGTKTQKLGIRRCREMFICAVIYYTVKKYTVFNQHCWLPAKNCLSIGQSLKKMRVNGGGIVPVCRSGFGMVHGVSRLATTLPNSTNQLNGRVKDSRRSIGRGGTAGQDRGGHSIAD